MYINSLSTAVTKSELILYADDAVLVFAALTPQELSDALRRDFNLISYWYIDNKLTLLSGGKTMLSQFNNFQFFADEG